jgi:3-hydroxymyristoyl/3-hydroxydecanoyl-(acyl carrier protein) dehydratase/acyl carrier protein
MPNPIDPNLLTQVKTMLRRDLKLGPDAPIADDMPLFGSPDLDLDSLDILLLVTSIEKELGVRIPNEAVGHAIFKDVSTLARYVQDRWSSQPAANVKVVDVPGQNWLDRLPHREPFRFVTRVTDVQPGKSAGGVWSVRGDEDFFRGHFPGRPIVPGLLIAEALAQIAGMSGPRELPDAGKLAHVDVRFEQSVTPPAEIELRATLQRTLGALQMCDVEARVSGIVVARGSLTLQRG